MTIAQQLVDVAPERPNHQEFGFEDSKNSRCLILVRKVFGRIMTSPTPALLDSLR